MFPCNWAKVYSPLNLLILQWRAPLSITPTTPLGSQQDVLPMNYGCKLLLIFVWFSMGYYRQIYEVAKNVFFYNILKTLVYIKFCFILAKNGNIIKNYPDIWSLKGYLTSKIRWTWTYGICSWIGYLIKRMQDTVCRILKYF